MKAKNLYSLKSQYKSYILTFIFALSIFCLIRLLVHKKYFPVLSFRECDDLPTQQTTSDLPALDITYFEENLHSFDQSDPSLIHYTRIKYLNPPSKLPYELNGGGASDRHTNLIREIFGNKRDGIFIEAGANEGVKGSHTIYLEKNLNWTGLLVECNPSLIPYLKSHHRKAWVAGVCLSPSANPGILKFSVPVNWTYSGKFGETWNVRGQDMPWVHFDVETMPLSTILAAIGWTEIDYFSFDVEGSELAILKSFPFDQVIFKVLVIEVFFYKDDQKAELDALLRANNYEFVGDFDAYDKVYVHNSAKDKLNLARFSKN